MKKVLFVAIAAALFSSCKKEGCIDENALNYNSEATEDNGTCVFSETSSEVVQVSSNDWSGDGDGYTVIINAPGITQNVIDNGAVMVYEVYDGQYIPLNYSWSNMQGTSFEYTTHTYFWFEIGMLYIRTESSDGDTFMPDASNYKIVIIDPAKLQANPNLDLKDYQAVEKALDL